MGALNKFKDKKTGFTYDFEDSVARQSIEELQAQVGGGLAVTGATVGQTVKIAAVDENGVPTAWEPVSLPGNESYELIDTITLTEDTKLDLRTEPNGTSYKYKSVMVFMTTTSNVASTNLYYYSGSTAVGLSYIGNKTTDTAGYASYECVQHFGRWLPKWKNGWATSESGGGIDRQNNHRWRLYSISDHPYITRIMTTGVLPTGTTIEIYGVRA